MRVLIRGCGVVGTRASRQLLTVPGVSELVLEDPREEHVQAVAASLGAVARVLGPGEQWLSAGADVVLLAGPPDHHGDAAAALRGGAHVVSLSDSLHDVQQLLLLDVEAKRAGRSIVVGAGFAPGLTCVLARHGAEELATVEEIHVAKFGTAGPECARQHHRALKSGGLDWRDGKWVSVPGGSGRELCWFPDPIAGADCYRAALADAVLLQPEFPAAQRITARMSATRRDRFTSRLPMLRKPHAEAGAGAVRVELRGLRNNQSDVVVFGCMDRPSVASAAVLAVATGEVLAGRCPTGAAGLARMVAPLHFLQLLAERGVRCARFEGSPSHAL